MNTAPPSPPPPRTGCTARARTSPGRCTRPSWRSCGQPWASEPGLARRLLRSAPHACGRRPDAAARASRRPSRPIPGGCCLFLFPFQIPTFSTAMPRHPARTAGSRAVPSPPPPPGHLRCCHAGVTGQAGRTAPCSPPPALPPLGYPVSEGRKSEGTGERVPPHTHHTHTRSHSLCDPGLYIPSELGSLCHRGSLLTAQSAAPPPAPTPAAAVHPLHLPHPLHPPHPLPAGSLPPLHPAAAAAAAAAAAPPASRRRCRPPRRRPPRSTPPAGAGRPAPAPAPAPVPLPAGARQGGAGHSRLLLVGGRG